MSTIPEVTSEKLRELYATFSKLFEEKVVNCGLMPSFDRVWIALHCVDMCVYKQYVNYFSIGLKEFRNMWNEIARELLKQLGVLEVQGEPLRQTVKFGDREMSMNQLINMLLLMYFSEHEDLCRMHVESIKYRIKGLSDIAKKFLRVLALDHDFLTYGFARFDEKWLGEQYVDKMREVYGQDFNLKDLEVAVVELNKLGLIMYCNIAIRDFQKLDVKIINEYYVAPHLIPVWKEVDKYL